MLKTRLTAILLFLFAWQQGVCGEDELQVLVDADQYPQAYELALSQYDDRVGDPKFDFLFGMAALESGFPDQALFAFERVVAAVPQDHRARLELARTHHALGNYEMSKQLFNEVLDSDPPPMVRENILGFLDLADERTKQRDYFLNFSAEMTSGVDSNINSASEVTTVTLPIGMVWTLDETSRALSDDFLQLNLTGNYTKLIRKDMGYFVSGSLMDRMNGDYDQFNLRVAAFSGGYIYSSHRFTLRLPVQWQRQDVDGDEYKTTTGLGAELSKKFDAKQTGALFAQWAQQRHVEEGRNQLRDVDLTLFGGLWSYEFGEIATQFDLSLYFAKESPIERGGEHFGRDYNGTRLAATWKPEAQHAFELSWMQQAVDYSDTHPSFAVIRSDSFSQFGFEWNWLFDPDWRVGMGISSANSKSNIEVYTYDRTQQYFKLKYSF